MPFITARALRTHYSGRGQSRRSRLGQLTDQQRRHAASHPAPCGRCGYYCGTVTIHQAGETFKSEACYQAWLRSLEAQ
jgi:hypothetical protein